MRSGHEAQCVEVGRAAAHRVEAVRAVDLERAHGHAVAVDLGAGQLLAQLLDEAVLGQVNREGSLWANGSAGRRSG